MPRLLLVLLFASLATYAQIPEIEGIGPFKIGKTTTSIVKKLATERNTAVQLVTQTIRGDIDPRGVYQIIGDIKPDAPALSSVCPQTKVYLVGRFEVAGIRLDKLYLTFYNDVLIGLFCDGSEDIATAMQVKYGNPSISNEVESVPCKGDTTTGRVYREETQTSTWIGSEASAGEAVVKYFDSSCNPQMLRVFRVDSNWQLRPAQRCDEESRAKLIQQKQADHRAKLKDF